MSQILASPLSGWLNISTTGASFAGSRDLSALVAVEFLPAGGQQVYYNFEHNHDGVYSGASHNHDGVYASASHVHAGLLKAYCLRYTGNNSALFLIMVLWVGRLFFIYKSIVTSFLNLLIIGFLLMAQLLLIIIMMQCTLTRLLIVAVFL